MEVVKADAISGKVFEWQLQHFSPHSNIKKKLNTGELSRQNGNSKTILNNLPSVETLVNS